MIEGSEKEIQEVEPEVVATEPPQDQPDDETIAEARKYGWRPKEEFDKNPEGWVDASRFLELPSTEVKRQKDERRAERQEFELRMSRIEAANKVAMERALAAQQQQHEAEVSRIRDAQRQAVETGDVQAWEALEKTRASLSPPQPVTPVDDRPAYEGAAVREVQDYRARNSWTKDPLLWDMAVRSVELNPHVKTMSPADQLAFAERSVREYFPHKFQQPKPTFSKVDGGGLGGAKGGKGVNDLPPEAIKAGKEFVADGRFKSLDDYATAYFAQG